MRQVRASCISKSHAPLTSRTQVAVHHQLPSERNMHSLFHRLLCAFTSIICGTALLLPAPSRATEPAAFEARFENDTEGTWLVYPTIPGWHYKIETSPTSAGADFDYLPGSFRYGDGQDRRWWIAPPPPPATPPDPPPPPRVYRYLNIIIYVATDPDVEWVEVVCEDQAHPWAARLVRSLYLRPHPTVPDEFLPCLPFLTLGDSPEARWLFSGSVKPRALDDFVSDPGGADFTPGSPEEQEYAFVLAHWDEALGHFTPNDEDAPLAPTDPPAGFVPPPGTPPPPPDPGVRRFFRVKQTAIDTNGNGLYDWWELQYGYSAFAREGEAGYAYLEGDPDNDGLTNGEEFTIGSDPSKKDTDGDFSPDGEEVDEDTDPTDADDCPSLLVALRRDLLYYISTRGDPPHYFHTRSFATWSAEWPGWELIAPEPEVETLPLFESLRGKLMQKIQFPAAMPEPPPYWYTARYFVGQAVMNIPDLGNSGSVDIIHHRVWHRGPAPADGPRLTPVIKSHYTGSPAVATAWYVRALATPTGQNYSSNFVDLLPGLAGHPHASTVANDPDGDGFFLESEHQYQYLDPLYHIVHGLSPQLDHETGEIFEGFTITFPPPDPVLLVEENPTVDRIAHRNIAFKLGHPGQLEGRTVTWTMEPLFVPPVPGGQPPPPPVFRGQWDPAIGWTQATAAHRSRFEVDPDLPSGFQALNPASGTTTIDANGFTAIRVNLPPIGFNKARIFAQVANPIDPTDEGSPVLSEKFPVADVEVPAVVVIDPGHGGTDPGNLGSDGTEEADMTLSYGLALQANLAARIADDELACRLLMTRATDVAVNLTSRPNKARDFGADIFLSIHFNSGVATARGIETFLERQQLPGSAVLPNHNPTQDNALAGRIQAAVLAAVQQGDATTPDRGVKTAGYQVILDDNNGNVHGYAPVRACLTEVEFLSNATALALLTGAQGETIRQAFATRVRDAILTDLNAQP